MFALALCLLFAVLVAVTWSANFLRDSAAAERAALGLSGVLGDDTVLPEFRDSLLLPWNAKARDYRSAYGPRLGYGVRPVDESRSVRLGYKRRLLRYKRVDEILVPEESEDSLVCDDYDHPDPAKRRLIECSLAEGENSCFRCIESRRYVRKCIHIGESLEIYRDYSVIVIPRNKDEETGYCLPVSFKQTQPPKDERNCNPLTGDWLLARLTPEGDSSYNWICRCRYPNLMTNETTVMTDCTRPVGCRHGHFDDETLAGRRNPYIDGHCECDAGYKSDFTEGVGPVCVIEQLKESDDLVAFFEGVYGTDDRYTIMSNDPAVDPDFARLFAKPVRLPNPCRVDSLTGERLEVFPYELRVVKTAEMDEMHKPDDVPLRPERAAACVPVSPHVENALNYVSTRADRDFLFNNGGRYANGITRVCELPTGSETRQPSDSFNVYGFYGRRDTDAPETGLAFLKTRCRILVDVGLAQVGNEALARIYADLTPSLSFDMYPAWTTSGGVSTAFDTNDYAVAYDYVHPGYLNARCDWLGDKSLSFIFNRQPTVYTNSRDNIKSRPWYNFRMSLEQTGEDPMEPFNYTSVFRVRPRDTQDLDRDDQRVDYAGYSDPNVKGCKARLEILKTVPYQLGGCEFNLDGDRQATNRAFRNSLKFYSPYIDCGAAFVSANCNNEDFSGAFAVVKIGDQLLAFDNGVIRFPKSKQISRALCYQKDLGALG